MDAKKSNVSQVITKKKVIGVLRNNENSNNNCIDILQSKRRMDWTREWLLKRGQFGHSDELLPEICFNELYHFNDHFKMSEKQFRLLIDKLAPIIVHQEPQRKKKSFSAEERLAITLKYLATGEVHSCRHYCFRASQTVILKMITEICLKIYENVKDEHIKLPITHNEWKIISKEFYNEYKLPNCIGALEVRHLAFKPNNKKCQMRDNKFFTSNTIALVAIIDAHSNFIYVDVGQKSTLNDNDLFNNSVLKKLIENNIIDLPKCDQLPNSDKSIPYYFVGGNTLPLKTYVMKQFSDSHLTSELFYDFVLWDVRQRVEHCFETLTNMFPILMEPFRTDEESARNVALGCIALYNFLKSSSQENPSTYSSATSLVNVNNLNSSENANHDDNIQRLNKTNCLLKITNQIQERDEELEAQRIILMDYVYANRICKN